MQTRYTIPASFFSSIAAFIPRCIEVSWPSSRVMLYCAILIATYRSTCPASKMQLFWPVKMLKGVRTLTPMVLAKAAAAITVGRGSHHSRALAVVEEWAWCSG